MRTEGFKYYAFISYSHKDKKLAKKLQRHLQSYHLPSALLKSHPNLPKKISPIFMDESNLVASRTLREALHDNLDNSNYLIVICSPNSAKSEYVNDEIEYFISQGRTDHIIPFIIDGEPHANDSSVECFPPAILNLPREHELLGIDMKKFGVRDSFSRVTATLLSLDLDNFVNYEKRRRIRKIVTLSSMAAVIMIAAGLFIWHNLIPHIKYYHTYVYRWGKPAGLFEVNESERMKKEYTYRFTTLAGEVKMIERVNSAGVLVDPTIMTPFTELPMIRFVSDRTVEYYDVNGKKIYRKEYTKNFEAADFYRGDEDLPYAIQSNTPDSYSVNKHDIPLGSKEIPGNIIRLTFEYDNNGYVIRKMFRLNNHGGDDNKGVNVVDSKGRGGFSYTVDDMGRVIRVRYLNKNRDVMSVGEVSDEYIEYGDFPYSNIVTYVDKDNYIVPNSQGVARIIILYESNNLNASALFYCDFEDEHVMNTHENISHALFFHDPDNGFLTSEVFYDEKGNYCDCIEGYNYVEFVRDNEGRITKHLFYDAEGKKIINSDDVADNDAQEEYRQGLKYLSGLKTYSGKESFVPDYKKAFEHFKKAADKGYNPAQIILGGMYEDGQGVEQDYKQAVYWYQKAAEQGNADAQCQLALMYKNGYGVEQDYKQTVFWWKKAAEQGNTTAQNNLALMYENGYGVEQDYKQAVYWYQKAAEQGYAAAQCNLGIMYHDGKGVEQNYERAVELYRKAAEQGEATAQFNLGATYYDGKGIAQDYKLAFYWYQKAAEQGVARAQFNLGTMYSNGYGIKQDYKKAVMWYMKAVAQGDAAAQCNLGLMYSNGKGIEQNYERAVELYRKAAEQGEATAQNNLGVVYENGLGVEKNLQTAYMWYYIAYLNGSEEAKLNLKSFESDEKEISETQINEAKTQALRKFVEIKEKSK